MKEREIQNVMLHDGDLDGETINVHKTQTTVSVRRNKKVYTYRLCNDGEWREIPSMKEEVGASEQ